MYDLAVVVPVRRGSSRIVEKAMLPFGDADSLIAWKLAQLVTVIDPARIYLSSEDDEFLAIASRFGVHPLRRDRRLAVDHTAPFSEVLSGIIRDVPHEHIAWSTVVCPLMQPAEYLRCFRRYRDEVMHGPFDSLVGVNLLKEYFWADGRALNYEASRNHSISQLLPNWYKVTNSLYMASRRTMLEREYFLGETPVMAELSKLAGVDIDYIEDYRIARALHAVYVEDRLDEIDPGLPIAWPHLAPPVPRAA